MIPLLLAMVLIGGRPESVAVEVPEAVDVATDIRWGPAGTPGPTVRFLEGSGWRFEFPTGSAAEAGYATVPLAGDWLDAWGVDALEIEYRGDGTDRGVDVVLTCARDAIRSRLDLASTQWRTVVLRADDFRGVRGSSDGFGNRRLRFLRFESVPSGYSEVAALDVRRITVLRADEIPSKARRVPSFEPARERGVEVVTGRFAKDGEPWFPFGTFLLGANRSLLKDLALAGANASMEYGPASWPLALVEDHLDFANHCGAAIVLNLADTLQKRYEIADDRLRSIAEHDALLAWYLLDEPDGAHHRGLSKSRISPERLEERARALAGRPVLATCLDAWGLLRYSDTANIYSTDYYWPAYADHHSPAMIFSHAESVTELAAATGAVPMLVLHLGDPQWSEPHKLQTPASLRAQAIGAIGGGIRGILGFQGVSPVRWHEKGLEEGEIWDAFLELAGEVATWGPLAARWHRVPGEPIVGPVLGEVRAACFEESGERWIAFVNMGLSAADIELSGECLADAEELVDPLDGWTGRVRQGQYVDRLESFEGRIVRISERERPKRNSVVEARVPAPDATVRYDQSILGASIYPAPETGSVRLWLDDEPQEVRVVSGAAAVARAAAPGLGNGRHELRLQWKENGQRRETRWTFEVDAISLPWEDDFAREDLGRHWTAVDAVRWAAFEPGVTEARGTAILRGGALEITSSGGDYGVILRRVEAPEAFRLTGSIERDRAGEILIQRNELVRRVNVPAGRFDFEWIESREGQQARVDGVAVARWTPPRDHRGGAIGLGVASGETARFDWVRIETR